MVSDSSKSFYKLGKSYSDQTHQCGIDGEGMGKIEFWENKRILISQEEYDRLDVKEGKYSSEKIESYFTLFESLLAPKSNPILAVEELHLAKQGSMDSGEFHAHVVTSYQGHNFLRHEQYMGQEQSHKFDE